MEIDDEPTTYQPKDIKHVARDTVNKICSSQVILNLAVAVKELVENSIDAGAKTVEVKIKNFGADGFEGELIHKLLDGKLYSFGLNAIGLPERSWFIL